MAELTDAGWSAALADTFARLIAETITEAQAAAEIAVATANWPTRSLSNSGLVEQFTRVLATLDGLIIRAGPPDATIGAPGARYLDEATGDYWGPRTTAGWPAEPAFSMVGPAGPASGISSATIAMLAPGSDPTVTLGGTPVDRTVAFGIPSAADGGDGDDGVTPNVSAAVTMLATGSDPLVTRSGPDSAPVFTFQLPRAADGTAGREVEMQAGVTHMQWRYVGDTAWINLYAKTELQGEQGLKGDAFQFDAKPATLADRDAYDAEAEGFTVLVMDTGMVFARVGATPGVWSDGFPFGQTQNAILEALSALNGTPGLLYQMDGETFAKRAIGAAADTDVLDRLSADSRYRLKGVAVPLADVADLGDALDEKADAAATLVLLGGKEDKSAKGGPNGYAGLGADSKVLAAQLAFATVAEVWAGTVADKIIPPSVLNAAMVPTALSITGGVVSPDCNAGINFDIASINANITIANLANKTGKGGRSGSITGKNDATAGRTVSLGTDWKKIGTTAFPTAANAMWKLVYNIDANGVNYSVMVLAA